MGHCDAIQTMCFTLFHITSRHPIREATTEGSMNQSIKKPIQLSLVFDNLDLNTVKLVGTSC